MAAALAIWLAAPANAAGDTATGPAAAGILHAGRSHITDAQGRQILLRGLNHLALRSDRNHPRYRQNGKITPAAARFELQDLEDADFAQIAALGFNVLRLVVTWEFAQPDPPPAPYNAAYFKRIDDFIAKARAHGLYVIFDFGQFGWGRSLGGNAGAPDWTVDDLCRKLPGTVPSLPPQTSVAVGCAYQSFWDNERVAGGVGVQDAYIDLWRYVAKRYRDEPAIAIYDLYNEPFGGAIPPGVFEYQTLYPFYRRLAKAIRSVDPDHAVGFQPELLHSLGVPTPFAVPIGIDNAVYLPHEYTPAYFLQRINPAYPPGQSLITRTYIDSASADARSFRAPLVIGETGWTRSTSADGVGGPLPATDRTAPVRFARDLTAAANRQHAGWAWFAYSSIDKAYGINYRGRLDRPLLQTLAQPYPRATAGRLTQVSYDHGRRRYRQVATDLFDAPGSIAVPLQWQYPNGACVRGDGAPLARLGADGKLTPLSEAAASRYISARATLVIDPLPAQVTIAPAPDCADRADASPH